jgi:hypothetical protein
MIASHGQLKFSTIIHCRFCKGTRAVPGKDNVIASKINPRKKASEKEWFSKLYHRNVGGSSRMNIPELNQIQSLAVGAKYADQNNTWERQGCIRAGKRASLKTCLLDLLNPRGMI